MKRFQFIPIPLILTLFLCATTLQSSLATQQVPIVDFKYLTGIERILYSASLGPGSEQYVPESELHFNDIAKSALEKLFLNSGIKLPIEWSVPVHPDEKKKVSVFQVELMLSVRPGHDRAKIAAISLRLKRGQDQFIPLAPVTYPLVLPDDGESVKKEITAGIEYLFGFIPSYISCAQKQTRSEPCHDLAIPYNGE